MAHWGGGGSRAVLYQGTNLSGRSFVIENYMPNLDGTGFNDRGSSLRIERGYWMFCSDANFEGECRTFGPGDYPTLSHGLNNRISSGRRISSEYPYNRSPNWGK
ncbi:MAG: beta/gamma crystallin family protein [Betaproteobacteria bacterium]|nr:beta/gamma crystallin family protein [Betaproteobacteria bacterium]